MKSTTKRSVKSEKQQYINIILISCAVILVIAAIFTVIAFIPRIKAKQRMNDIEDFLSVPEICEVLLISDLKSGSDIFGGSSGEAAITDSETISELSKKLDDVIDVTKYSFSKNMSSGAWGIRLRFYVLEYKYEVYLEEDRIYILNGERGYYFVPKNSDAEKQYSEFYAYVLSLIEE